MNSKKYKYNNKKGNNSEEKKDFLANRRFREKGFEYVTLYNVNWAMSIPKDYYEDMFIKLKDEAEEEYYESQEMEKDDYQEQLDNGDISDASEYLNEEGTYGLLYNKPFKVTDELALKIKNEVIDTYREKINLPRNVTLEFTADKSLEEILQQPKEVFLKKVEETFKMKARDFKTVKNSTESQIFSYNVEKNLTKIIENKDVKRYMSFFDNFRNYNHYNRSLVYMQCPQATMVKTANAWKALGRYINAGEKAILIEQRTDPKKIYNEEKLEDYLDDNYILTDKQKDNLRKEFKEKGVVEVYYQYHKSLAVFDISQTNGKEIEIPKVDILPELSMLNEDDRKLVFELQDIFKDYLQTYCKVKPEIMLMPSDRKYSYSNGSAVLSINSEQSPVEVLATLVEASADIMLHYKGLELPGLRTEVKLTEAMRKLETCAVAFNILEKIGIPTSYPFNDMVKFLGTDMSADARRSKCFHELMSRVSVCSQHIENNIYVKLPQLEHINERQRLEIEKPEFETEEFEENEFELENC